MTITLGYWLVPLFLTILFFVIAGPMLDNNRILPVDSGANFGVIDFNYGIRFILIYGAAVLGSLMAWAIYFTTGVS